MGDGVPPKSSPLTQVYGAAGHSKWGYQSCLALLASFTRKLKQENLITSPARTVGLRYGGPCRPEQEERLAG